MHYLIVGAGVAGMTAAMEIRKRDNAGRITMLGAETIPCYSRIRLIDYLAGTVAAEGLVLKKQNWYAEQDITCVLGDKALRLDEAGKEIVTANESHYPYDRLLLATGSTCFVPPIAGYPKKGIFTLRTIADADHILAAAKDGEIILLGGGVLGLEAGHSLMRAGGRITVVELVDRLLPRQMDPAGSALLRQKLENAGCRFRLGHRAVQFIGGDSVEGVTLDSGEILPGRTVVISAGVLPDTSLAAGTSIIVDRGFVVNRMMETSSPGIFAAGDCASLEGRCHGLWSVATDQGRVAGANMAGDTQRYEPMPPSNILKVAGVDLFSVGNIDPDGLLRSFTFVDQEEMIYRKLVLEGGRAVGAILFGNMSKRREIMTAVTTAASLSAGQADDMIRVDQGA